MRRRPSTGERPAPRAARDAVVRALLGLIADGDLRPTAGRIAERAGISLRSVYVHFEDLDDLFVAASREQRSRVAALVRSLPTTGPFEDRLAAFVAQRARVLEAIGPVAKATALHEPFSPALAAVARAARRQGRAELERIFATELAAFEPPSRAQALDACDALTSSDSWDFLRVRRGLTARAASGTVTAALRRLLEPPVPSAARQPARRWRARRPDAPNEPGGQERR